VTRSTNARIAGVTFFVYLGAGIASLVLTGGARARDPLAMLTSLSALVLGVTLYAITREQDPDLALFGLVCRVVEGVPGEGTIYVAVSTAVFSWLLFRGRMIPVVLAWLGILASLVLVVILPLQRAGVFVEAVNWFSRVTWLLWLPMLVFQVALAVWLIVKGVATPARVQAV
jgi:hypothetical protein